jgi:hypothetical protein
MAAFVTSRKNVRRPSKSGAGFKADIQASDINFAIVPQADILIAEISRFILCPRAV